MERSMRYFQPINASFCHKNSCFISSQPKGDPALTALSIGMTIVIFFFSLISTPPAFSAVADAANATIIAMGKHPISKSITQAKQNAVTDALTSAIKRAVIEMLTPSQLTDNLEFVAHHFNNASPDRYISTYKIIGDAKDASTYFIAVEATINMVSLQAFLQEKKILTTESQLPKLLLLISEKQPDDAFPQFWWSATAAPHIAISEQQITDILTAQGFTFVDGQTRHPNPEEMGIFFTSINDPEAAVAFGKQLNADVIIMGAASAQEDANVMGDERGYQGEIELDIYSAQSGLKLASISKSALAKSPQKKVGLNTALTLVGKTAGEALSSTLMTVWKKEGTPVNIIKANIKGADYLSSFIMLRKTLSTMTHIENVQTRELGAEQAIVDISYRGDGKALANTLMLKSFDTFGLELSDVTEDALTIRFIPKSDTTSVKPSEMEGVFSE